MVVKLWTSFQAFNNHKLAICSAYYFDQKTLVTGIYCSCPVYINFTGFWFSDIINQLNLNSTVAISGIGMTGEMIIISNVTRHCDDTYECQASNGVLPDVARKIKVTVQCEYST